jgi:hypothetical protein
MQQTISLIHMTSVRRKLTIFSIAGLLTILSFITHYTSPSSMHYEESHWQQRLELHQSHPAFKARPFTTNFVLLIKNAFGLSHRTAFFILHFLLLIISGPVFYCFLSRLGFDFRPAIWGMIIYFLSLPVFMAHFDPVYTWSDFWVYIFIPLSFIYLLQRKYIPAILAFMIAMMARETTLIFLPVWFLFAYSHEAGKPARPVTACIAILILSVSLRFIIFGTESVSLHSFVEFNFNNALRSSDTIFSLLVSLGFVWALGLFQLFSTPQHDFENYHLIRFGVAVTASGFILSTLLLAQARETRLFFPSFAFLIPLTLIYFSDHAKKLHLAWRSISAPKRIVFLMLIMGISWGIVRMIFPEFEFRTWKDGNRVMLALHLAVTLIMVLFQSRLFRPPTHQK